MAYPIRHISFSEFRKHLSQAMRFVDTEHGHLWLRQHGRYRGVVIPMKHEAVLHRAVGLDPQEAFHRAMVDCDRAVSAINEGTRWASEALIDYTGHGYPAQGLTDESYRTWVEMARARGLFEDQQA